MNYVGGGLKAVKEITEFEIAAADKVYKPATAVILTNNRIKLSNTTISEPLFIRYAFKNNTTISIFTTDELPLPLSPFRYETTTPIVDPNSDLSEITFDKIANVYASSTFLDRTPISAVNGAGLIGNAHEALVASKAWHTDNLPFPHFFKIELKEPQEIAAMRIWNLNWTSTYLNRGVKDIEIYISESASSLQNVAFSENAWEKVMNYTMTQASGLNTYTGELLNFSSSKKNINWVGIKIMNSYNSANGYMGISEIKLFSPKTNTATQKLKSDIFVNVYKQGNDLYIHKNDNHDLLYYLFSIHGTRLKSGTIDYNNHTISLAGLPIGVYILNLNNGNSNQSLKILI